MLIVVYADCHVSYIVVPRVMIQSVVKLNVAMLSVVSNVVMLSVVTLIKFLYLSSFTFFNKMKKSENSTVELKAPRHSA
jgi:hypothetical protein